MTNVPEDSRLTKEEVFGPALPDTRLKLWTRRRKSQLVRIWPRSSIWTRNLLHANKAIVIASGQRVGQLAALRLRRASIRRRKVQRRGREHGA